MNGRTGRCEYWRADIETMPRERMRERQERLLTSQLAYLERASPLYRRKFKECGFAARELKSIGELAQLPFTTKQELRVSQEEAHPFGIHLAAPLENVVLMQTTSGTSGRPVFQAFTQADLKSRYEVYSRVFHAWGLRPGDTIVHGLALSMFGGGVAVCNAAMSFGAMCAPIGAESSSERLLHLLREIRPAALLLTPSYAEHLINRCHDVLGVEAKELGVRVIGCFAEPGGEDPVVRPRLEQGWGATVYDGGGSSDAAPILFANCRERTGKHFFAEDFGIVELLDCDTGRPIELHDGAEGEWVFTHLTREACPLLRFRAGDRIKVFTSACRCGRTAFRMLYLGRIDEMLIVRGVNVFPTAVKSVVEEFVPRTTGELRITLPHRGPKVDSLRIRVERGRSETDGSAKDLAEELEHAIRIKLHVRAQVEIVDPGSIPRPSTTMGKAKLVEITGT